MKKLIVASALALTATVAVAGTQINLRKVNKIVASVIQPELTPLINAIEIKIDERSNLQNIQELKTGVSLSATARESKWSKSPTTLDFKASLKSGASDAKKTKMEVVATAGSKTDAVSLYSYAATTIAADMENDEGEQSPMDKEFLAWFKTAAQTKSLDAIPTQLEQLIVLMKKLLVSEAPNHPDEEWVAYSKLIDGLRVDTKIHNYKTVEVILKTTTEIVINDFLFGDIVISNLSLKISRSNINLNGKFILTGDTENVSEFLESMKSFLSSIENADVDVLAELRSSAKSYIEMAEAFVKGEN